MKRSFQLFACLTLLFGSGSLFAQSNVGRLELDSAFASGNSTPGKYEMDFEGNGSLVTCYFANRFSTQLLAGCKISTSTTNTLHFGLVHYDVYGNPQPGFGTNGRVDLSWSGNDYPLHLVLMTDNSVFAAGTYSPTSGAVVSPFKPAVYKIKSNGTPDSLFGTTGRVVIPDATVESGAFTNLDTLQASGSLRIAAMGYTNSTTGTGSTGFYAAWLNAAGALDQNFGTNGITHVTTTGLAHVHGMLLPDLRYLFVGLDSTGHLLLCRLTANGKADATFGTNGLINTGILLRSEPYSAFSSKDNNLYVTASLTDTSSHVPYALFRFNVDGAHDMSYGTNGFISDPIFLKFTPHGIGISNDGSILFAGEVAATAPAQFASSAAIKFFARGVLDSSFGINGMNKLDADFGTRHNYIKAFVPLGKLDGSPTSGHFAGIGNTFPSAGVANFLVARYTQIPILKQSTAILSFGKVDTGSSLPMTFKISNYDSIAHLIDSANAPGTQVFVVTSPTMPLTMAPGQTVTFTVVYRPIAIQGDTTQLTVYDHSGLHEIVGVQGAGVAGNASVNIEQNAPTLIHLSPNPALSTITVAIDGETIERLTVLDALGRVIRTVDTHRAAAQTNGCQVDVTELADGDYFCTVQTNAGIRSSRFTVAH